MDEEYSQRPNRRRRPFAAVATTLLAIGGIALLRRSATPKTNNEESDADGHHHSVRRRELFTPLPYDDPDFLSEEALENEMTNWQTLTLASQVYEVHTDPVEEFLDENKWDNDPAPITMASRPVRTLPPGWGVHTDPTETVSTESFQVHTDPTDTTTTATTGEQEQQWPNPIGGSGTNPTSSTYSSTSSNNESMWSSSTISNTDSSSTEENNLDDPTTTPQALAPPRPPKWHPKLDENGDKTCVYGSDYPEDYATSNPITGSFLFETQKTCCMTFNVCHNDHADGGAADEGNDDTGKEYWYPLQTDEGPACLLGADYPEDYAHPQFRETFLFDDEAGCCETHPIACEEATTIITSTTMATAASAATTTTTTATSTTTTSPDPCTDCEWHESIFDFKTCTNSPDYPDGWDQPQARAYFFFRNAKDCCNARFPGDCAVVDVTSASSSNAGGSVSEFVEISASTVDSFDNGQLIIPFDLGTPIPGWKISNKNSYSGSHSITNIPAPLIAGATSDLVLKISVSQPSSIQCMGKIDTSMPFDFFTLHIDGQQRNTYHTMYEEWVEIGTGFGAGEHTIVFRVENSNKYYHLNGIERTVENFGSGQVYLDDCEIVVGI